MITLKYGNTNTFLIPCSGGWMLVDTDYAGTLQAFYKALKEHDIKVRNIKYVLATHYHPDHMGLIPDLMRQGVRLLLTEEQRMYVHFSDRIFRRDGLAFTPIDIDQAVCLKCPESRPFLEKIGIAGEIISTPSHSPDSIALVLDSGDCFVGDLEPVEYLEAYEDNPALRTDWTNVLKYRPKMIWYAHANRHEIESEGIIHA